jgi:hypothetical protein
MIFLYGEMEQLLGYFTMPYHMLRLCASNGLW